MAGFPAAPPLRPPVVFEQFDGLSYVGLIAFEVRDLAVRRRPVPYFGRFLETNVRLYSVDASGRHGVLFCSLETARAAVLVLPRLLLGIRYVWSRMRVRREGDVVHYASTRRFPQRRLRSALTVRVGEPVEPTPLEVWLTAR